ncbi:MAG TPA: hypothetical protein VNR68_03990 [Sphingomicrobium sp.]|nr:hypothetical protein [Sphingomicrobium sp.]
MIAVLLKGGPEFIEKLLGHFGRMTSDFQPSDQFFLSGDVTLSLGDVVVDHPHFVGVHGHGSSYHLARPKSKAEAEIECGIAEYTRAQP